MQKKVVKAKPKTLNQKTVPEAKISPETKEKDLGAYLPPQRHFYDYRAIMERYDVGTFAARNIIQSIRKWIVTPKLPVGKVLASELYAWESDTGAGQQKSGDVIRETVEAILDERGI